MKIFTVSQLTQEIKKQLEQSFQAISVQGEVINLKIQSSGHIYFTLKDQEAQISAVLFKGATKNLSRLPKEGDQIIAQGEISLYSPRGTYQILIRNLQYQGIGQLLAELHTRKQKFAALGYFSAERKKKLPSFPKTIGVITSPTGAVIQDILHILERRHSGFHLVLYPVKVQGIGAKEEIAKAIYDCNQYKLADVLIVGRGGGSLEDLWAFNEDLVVEAIAQSEIPIISAVGHETDFSLSDFVADVRAPTPSAAAEIVLAEKASQEKFLIQAQQRLDKQMQGHFLTCKQQIASIKKNPYILSPYLLFSRKLQQMDESKNKLNLLISSFLKQNKTHLLALKKQKDSLEPSYRLRLAKERLQLLQKNSLLSLQQILRSKKKLFDLPAIQKNLDRNIQNFIQQKYNSLDKISAHLTSIDPKNLLKKGYCILFSENKESVILSSKQITPAQKLHILLGDGIINAKVEEVIYESL